VELEYRTRQAVHDAVVEWRGAGERVGRAADSIADSFDRLCDVIERVLTENGGNHG
jgi:hypothetical protein